MVLHSNAFSEVVNYSSNLASLFGARTVSNVLNFTAAAVAGYNGNFTAVAAKGVQGLGSGISSYAATMAARYPATAYASGVLYLAGAAVTTWGYVAEQASYIDPHSPRNHSGIHQEESRGGGRGVRQGNDEGRRRSRFGVYRRIGRYPPVAVN